MGACPCPFGLGQWGQPAGRVVSHQYGWAVPRLSEFYGIVIYMYFNDHNPPHFHALYAEHEGQIRIDDGEVIEGSLPRTAARLVRQWLELHRDELMENWELAQIPAPLVAIEPLQ